MKIVLVMVACGFAAVQCQNIQCAIDGISANSNLQSCVAMSADQTSGTFDLQAYCGLSCLDDLRAVYDTCGVSPNPVEAREFILFISLSLHR